ncbi:MAG: histidine phosphatase family protein, partial [Pyrinomonadaceae bacterium]|nr:histidine phosphatase family protein [Pyrinomonadaceae bacterium]
MRHAKSDWGDQSLSDFERPLNDRGQRAAPLIGGFLRREKLQPQLALSSPAERARQTARLVIEAAGIAGVALRYDERIYEASAAQLQSVIAQIEEDVSVALLIGHNPGFTDLLAALTGEAQHMPTAALAQIALNIEKWSGVSANCGQL